MAVAALDHFFFSFEIPSMESQVFSPNKITQYTLHISHLVIFFPPQGGQMSQQNILQCEYRVQHKTTSRGLKEKTV